MSLGTRFGKQHPTPASGIVVEIGEEVCDSVVTVGFDLGDGVKTVVALDDPWLMDNLAIGIMEAAIVMRRRQRNSS